jgi:hypothetical protein
MARYAPLTGRQAEELRTLKGGRSLDDLSFGQAFNAAKAAGKPDFPWRGATYSTQTAEEQGRAIKAAPGSGRGASAGRTAKDVSTAPMRRAESAGPDAQAVAERLKRLPALESNEEARDRYRENTLNALVGLGTVAGAPLAARIGRALGSAPARAPRATEALVRDSDAVPFKKGGKVKTYAKGGSVRGAGCETRTKKTRFV